MLEYIFLSEILYRSYWIFWILVDQYKMIFECWNCGSRMNERSRNEATPTMIGKCCIMYKHVCFCSPYCVESFAKMLRKKKSQFPSCPPKFPWFWDEDNWKKDRKKKRNKIKIKKIKNLI
jgi:hypothetical protein